MSGFENGRSVWLERAALEFRLEETGTVVHTHGSDVDGPAAIERGARPAGQSDDYAAPQVGAAAECRSYPRQTVPVGHGANLQQSQAWSEWRAKLAQGFRIGDADALRARKNCRRGMFEICQPDSLLPRPQVAGREETGRRGGEQWEPGAAFMGAGAPSILAKGAGSP